MQVHYKQRNVLDVINDYIEEAAFSNRRVDYIELQAEEMEEFLELVEMEDYRSVNLPFDDSKYYVYKDVRIYEI